MAETMWMCSKCNTFNPNECKCGFAVIEMSHFCPILDLIWDRPITDETFKKTKFFCWVNNVYWYERPKEDFFAFRGRELAAKKGCKYVVMNNLS